MPNRSHGAESPIPESRIEHVRRLVKGEYPKILALNVQARVLYIYGAFICDDTGFITHEQLEPPYDLDALAEAERILVEFNLVGVSN